MRAIAFLISADMVAGNPASRADQYEFELEFAELEPACRAAGFDLRPVVWDGAVEARGYDALVIGTAWDYVTKKAQFLAALERWAAVRPVLNPPGVVRWNVDKTYLKDLADAGAPVIETVWAERASADAIRAAFETLGTEDIVVKPVVGAGGWRQARIRRGEPLPAAGELPPAEAMIQPFLPAVAQEGEYSFLFFGGEFSHAALKRPRPGDYRVQSVYGGHEEMHAPSPEDVALAREALAAACRICGQESLLYARVDMARGPDGRLALMELELIEPYLYPEQGPGMGARFASALKARLG
ncbi:hypothetical protein E5163_07915 [Marinicauda algicola]|uniref:Uncharacterized protein n=1 Tax=Marinicauda algicola TaxID=2029849 RepID=A0A4S2H0J9_9PROT|nr:hypothetical protein [Marinicauda algicola]TGY89045.1 hypothetical protein E5163_07915 [Marinicauda algicola]